MQFFLILHSEQRFYCFLQLSKEYFYVAVRLGELYRFYLDTLLDCLSTTPMSRIIKLGRTKILTVCTDFGTINRG